MYSMHPDALNESIILNFGMRNNIAVVITHVKFYVNRFRGFRAVTPRSLSISIAMTGVAYNSVRSTVLQCE